MLSLAVAVIFVFSRLTDVFDSEPDLYFHLVMARRSAEEGVVRSIPQIEDLGWGKVFPEKSFLHTQLLGLAYRIGGERLVLLTPYLFSSVLIFGLFLLLLPEGIGVALLAAAMPLFIPEVAHRLVLLRPHTLALPLYLAFLASLLRRRPVAAFVSLFLFCWAYHAFYLPLFLLTGYAVIYRPFPRAVLLSALAGWALGLVSNPYFPLNLDFAWVNAHIALFPDSAGNALPLELLRMPWSLFFTRFGLFLAVLPLTAVVLRRSSERSELGYMLFCSVVLWGLTAISRRALEYAAVTTAIALAMSLARLPRPQWAAVAYASLALAVQGIPIARFYLNPPRDLFDTGAIFAALRAISPLAGGEKVLNVEWETGPYILYARPDLRFVDIWGPYLLERENPRLHRLREELRADRVKKPHSIIHDQFHARFVLLEQPKLAARLDRDPLFKRLYPPVSAGSSVFLYEVAETVPTPLH